jgi:hypothetical protein
MIQRDFAIGIYPDVHMVGTALFDDAQRFDYDCIMRDGKTWFMAMGWYPYNTDAVLGSLCVKYKAKFAGIEVMQ